MTGLVIVTTGAWKLINPATDQGFTGAELTAKGFTLGLPGPGGLIVAFGIIFFAFSTTISWSYYGERSVYYLLGPKFVAPYRWLFAIALPIGAALKLDLVWAVADVANGLMAFPNLIGILGLSGIVIKTTEDYFGRMRREGHLG